MSLIDPVTYTGAEPGKRLLVLGAVHGNEKCGTFAIQRIIREIESGDIKIARGSVTFVPICNKAAFDADVRYIDRNLNRFLVPHSNPTLNEEKIGNELCPLLEQCDVLLDLHSYTVGGDPFVFIGAPDTEEHIFANCLGGAAGITGWAKAYAASGRESVPTDPDESTGTTEYARRFGAMGVTLECGQHRDENAPAVAYQAIRNALNYLGLCDDLGAGASPLMSRLIEVKRVFFRGQGGDFTKGWKHLEPVKKGEVIATDEHHEPLSVPDDGYLILPHRDTHAGTEWFYWGQARVSARPKIA